MHRRGSQRSDIDPRLTLDGEGNTITARFQKLFQGRGLHVEGCLSLDLCYLVSWLEVVGSRSAFFSAGYKEPTLVGETKFFLAWDFDILSWNEYNDESFHYECLF